MEMGAGALPGLALPSPGSTAPVSLRWEQGCSSQG